jgi:hypothetical protein
MFQKHHITFTTFFLETVIQGIQSVRAKDSEKLILEKTIQGTINDITYIVYMGNFAQHDAMNGI